MCVCVFQMCVHFSYDSEFGIPIDLLAMQRGIKDDYWKLYLCNFFCNTSTPQ